MWAWRVLRVHDPHRAVSAPFVGREGELELLENSLGRAVRDRRVQLVTVYGEPGLGKTRLVSEFVESLERVTTLSGRTLPYGEGVTYWPLASMIKASAGITDDDPANNAFEKLRLCCESEAVADLLAVALGVLGAAEGERTPEQLTWAALRWAEQLADVQPLVLVFEDVHWAEEPLLELIEHLARSLKSSPVLIIAVARPELLDTRPSWGGGIRSASAIELVPLDARESEELADALMSESDVPPAQRALVLERAEGNPLFLEEIARVLGDGREALERIPETVQALIAARIDLLEPDEKRVLQSAALIGRVFWRGALDRLAPDLDVGCMLDGLLAREFIVPEERSTISGDRAFRFKHVLIRDVAYSGMSKAQRAEQHQAFAQWVDERAHDEFAEIRAHHLDEAAQLLNELDGSVPAELAREAAAAADVAGRRALRRGAYVVARRMLLRATELEPNASRRYLAAHAAWRLSDVPSVRDEAEGALADARAEGVRNVEGRALVLLAELALHADSDVARAHDLADEALAILPAGRAGGPVRRALPARHDLLVARRRRGRPAARRGDARARARGGPSGAREPRADAARGRRGRPGPRGQVARAARARDRARRAERQPRGDGVRARSARAPRRRRRTRAGGGRSARGAGDLRRDRRSRALRLGAGEPRRDLPPSRRARRAQSGRSGMRCAGSGRRTSRATSPRPSASSRRCS